MKGLLGETRFYFAQCAFNTSCHYAAIDRITRIRSIRQYVALGISIITVAILVLNVIFWECNNQYWLRILSITSTLFTAVSLSFEFYNREDLTEFIFYHKQAAEDYKTLRDKLMDLIRVIYSNESEIDVDAILKECLRDYSLIGKYSLTTTYEDYQTAQGHLGLVGKNESFTWSNEEIDRFLPEELWICKDNVK